MMRRYLSQRAFTAALACSELRAFDSHLPDLPPRFPDSALVWLRGCEEELLGLRVAMFGLHDD